MARAKVETPWNIEFPQVCAGCTAAATRTLRIQRQKPSAQQWFFLFGAIGAAIAGAGKEGSLRLEIPYCRKCHRWDHTLIVAAWGAFVLGMLFLCGFMVFAAQGGESSDVEAVAGVLGTLLGTVLLIIAAPVLAIVQHARRAVHLKRIDERSESVVLAFRNLSYFDEFCRGNLERIVSFALRHGKELPLPVGEAIAAVSQRIDEQNPRSPEGLKGYFERGQLYLQAGMGDQAITDLDRVIEVTGFENPYFLEAQFFRGQAHMQRGDAVQAETDLGNYVQAASDRARVRQAKRWLKEMRRR